MTEIIGISLTDRVDDAIEFQKIITKFGCIIRTRIGLHHLNLNACSENGLILLDVTENSSELKDELNRHWIVKTMVFD